MECSFLKTVDVKRSSHICVFWAVKFRRRDCECSETVKRVSQICRLCKSEKSRNSCSEVYFYTVRGVRASEFVFLGVFLHSPRNSCSEVYFYTVRGNRFAARLELLEKNFCGFFGVGRFSRQTRSQWWCAVACAASVRTLQRPTWIRKRD